MALPRPGDVLRVGAEASPQFGSAELGTNRPILFRVTKVDDKPTYDGWCWLHGYEVDTRGEAIRRRELFVDAAGLRLARTSQEMRTRNAARRLRSVPGGKQEQGRRQSHGHAGRVRQR